MSDTPIRLVLGVPAYPAVVSTHHMISALSTFGMLKDHGIECLFMPVGDCALVGHARAILVSQMLKHDCTHLLMVDADVAWKPEAVLRLLNHNVPIVGATQPDKSDGMMYFDIGRYPNVPAMVAHEYDPSTELLSVKRMATCFMLIQRRAIDRMIEAYPELRVDGNPRMAMPGTEGLFYGFFEQAVTNHHWPGEDVAFCEKWTALGGKLFVDPHIELAHSVKRVVRGKLADFLGLQSHD